jgi:hypothetical protein
MCYNTPNLLKALKEAERIGRTNCENLFKDEKWNCTGFSILTASNTTKYATKETSYILSLMAASLAHVITKDCRDNGMDCPCGENVTSLLSNVTIAPSKKCSINIDFGAQMALEFMSAGKSLRDPLTDKKRVDLHNIVAGTTIFLDQNRNSIDCSCLGASASCTLQSCRRKLVDITAIASALKEKYSKACNVSVLPFSLKYHCKEQASNSTLVYTEKSPDYCYRDISRGSYGVTGRKCDVDSSGPNNCNIRCCGRGHNQHTVKKLKQKCDFVWCCYFECTDYFEDEHIYTCK